jgi:hypothetical protein
MKRLDELESKLSAEIAAIEISGAVEAALLREFDTHKRRRTWPYWTATIAAGLVAAFWLLPHRTDKSPTRPAAASAQLASAPVAFLPAPLPSRPHRRRARKPAPQPQDEFTAIPFAPPLAPYERAEILQVDMPVSALSAAGIQIATTDTSARARADFLVGADGTAHAFRLISVSNSLNH